MDNTTLTFTMTAYAVMENYKHGVFVVFFLLYLITVTLNSLLVMVVYKKKELHQPMNMFTCVLALNEIYGSTALYPATMSLLLSNTHKILVQCCLAQVFFLHTYAGAEFCVLAIMAYDRYVAICHPLHYHSIMPHAKIIKIIAAAVLYPFVVFGSFYSLTLQLRFCGQYIPKLYCVNMEVVKTSCSPVLYISTVGLVLIVAFVVPQMVMIIFSYAQISRVCWKLSKESQANALKTCVPHLLSLLNYAIGALFEIIQTRFNMSYVPVETRSFLSLYFIIIPSIANPVLYGFGTQLIRIHILRILLRSKILPMRLAKAVML